MNYADLVFRLDCGHLCVAADLWRYVNDDGDAICHHCTQQVAS